MTLGKNDTIFKKTIVYDGLEYGGKTKSVALLVENQDLNNVTASVVATSMADLQQITVNSFHATLIQRNLYCMHT